MRTKLLAAVFVAAGALGLTGGAMILSNADAQTGGSSVGAPPGVGGGGLGAPPGPGSGLPGAGGIAPPRADSSLPGRPGKGTGTLGPGLPGMYRPEVAVAGHAAWEYKFVEQKSMDRDEFEKTLTKQGNDGWEYAGSERLSKGVAGAGGAAGGLPPQWVLIFKRPKGGATGGMMGGMGMPGMGGGLGGGGGMRPGGPGGGGSGGASNIFEVFTLKHVAAEDVVQGLRKAFPAAKLLVVAEKASNSVIVIDADAATMKEVTRLIGQLDTKPVPLPKIDPLPKPAPGPRPTPGGGDTGGTTPMGGGSSLGPVGGSGGLAPPMGGPPPRPEAVTNVMVLKHADAAELAAVLKKVFPQSGEFTADPRTNQLIIRADQETLQEVAALVERLDIEVPKKR